MKEITAVIRPAKLGALRDALRGIEGFPGMTVSKAEGCSAPTRHVPHTIKEELTDFTPKTRIEIVAPDDVAEVIYDAIVHIAQTGNIGDGLVWMTEIQRASFIHKTTG
ncbi:MAG: transcriptional regulator [Candidatus Accumulibacter sp.]|nr:transcriptional regulator [Accumulibacter sp.]